MGRVYDDISGQLFDWLKQQPVFFVGTAPAGPEGHVNVSPKGARDAIAILGPRRVAYLDMIGSGVETVAHLRENGRIVLMFCAFTGPPKIIRLHGRGRVVVDRDPEFGELLPNFVPNDDVLGISRAIVVVDVDRIADSCGYTVPLMDFVGERDQLFRWAETRDKKLPSGWKNEYRRENNTFSIDGLPGIDPDPAPAIATREAAGPAS